MKATIPKILHLYWGKDKPLSWLRWMTIRTFSMLNPDWQIILWYPRSPGRTPKWPTREHSHYSWSGEDWFRKASEAGPNVETRVAPIDDFPLMTEVHRSDLLRWRLLHTMGGFWSDIDIVFFRPMETAGLDMTADALLCWGETDELAHWQAIGFLAGKPGNSLFKAMEAAGLGLSRLPSLGYQEIGTELLIRFAPARATDSMGTRIGQIPQHVVYPFKSVRSQQAALWGNHRLMDLRETTCGIHWFAAQPRSCLKEALWTGTRNVESDLGLGGVKWAMAQLGLVAAQDDGIKYSIIMPYINRPVLLHNTLLSYHHWYSGRKDWEAVIIRDSKCDNPGDAQSVVDHWIGMGLNINMLDFDGSGIYSPAPLFNFAAENASGEFIVLTNPEQFHNSDILAGMDQEFKRGQDQYVVCACISMPQRPLQARRMRKFTPLKEKGERWVQHSVHRPMLYHFCSALSKDNYFKCGGFAPEFGPGFCFDDDDFRESVRELGIPIVQRDDLITAHQWHPSCNVPGRMEKWHRNKALYESRHGRYITMDEPLADQEPTVQEPRPATRPGKTAIVFACVLKSGGAFTPDYVSRLVSAVERNTTVPHDFVCLTDMSIKGCRAIRLVDNLPGWWSKLELFRPGLFPDGIPVVYFDLDTLILGNIDGLALLTEGFHALRPWNPVNRSMGYCGSGFMVWTGGQFEFIHNRFVRSMTPTFRGGDQEYISRSLAAAGMNWRSLQDSVGGIYSYKRQCRSGPPPGARIVCFHGRPRIHECQDQWVREAWN